MAFKINEDHWAFLEDIEAPMWVDLNLEANSNNQDNDDKWFYTSHQFHHCSSRELKSVFSHSGDGSTLDFDLLGPSSPKLPPSVSKSRGKQYKSKKWKGDKQKFSFDKPHLVKEDIGSSLSSEANKRVDSNPTSTVTTETESGHKKKFRAADVSSQAFGHTNGFLSAMKISLRKSYISRQATRMEINKNRKQLRGRNSTSSKSSVGSSSNPRHDVRISTSASMRTKEMTPDSRNVGRMTYVAKSKINSSGIEKAPSIKIEEGSSNNRKGGQANTAKATCQEAAKQKVVYQRSRAKALAPSRVSEQGSIVAAAKAKKKVGASVIKSNNLVGDGKENVTGKMAASQKKSNGRDIDGGGMTGRGQKETKQSVSGRNDIAGTVRPKQGKGRGQGNFEKPRNLIQGVHFR